MITINGGGITVPDAEMFIKAAITIGQRLSQNARSLLVAWSKGPMDIPNTCVRIAGALGVGELDESASLFAEWEMPQSGTTLSAVRSSRTKWSWSVSIAALRRGACGLHSMAYLLPSLFGEKYERKIQ